MSTTPRTDSQVRRPHVPVPKQVYVPARDNPQENIRPGADDHKKHKSLGPTGQAVYHDRGHK